MPEPEPGKEPAPDASQAGSDTPGSPRPAEGVPAEGAGAGGGAPAPPPAPGPGPEPAPAAPPSPAPAGLEPPARKAKLSGAAASAAVAGIAVAATALQNLWQQGLGLVDESRETTGLVPLVLLGGVAGLVALAIVVLVLRHLGRLVFSSRMTVALLSGVALICLAGMLFEPESAGTGRGAYGTRNEDALARRFEPLVGAPASRKVADKLMILARTAGLTDVPGSWALYALLGMLALGSAAGLIWRRPVGAREFGFLGTHLGALLIMGGVAAGMLFGYHRSGMTMGLDQPAQNVPVGPASGAAFALAAREIQLEPNPVQYRVLAWSGSETPTELEMDGGRPGDRARWRDLDVEVADFRPDALPEEHVVDSGEGVRNPAVRVALSASGTSKELVLEAFGGHWRAEHDFGTELRFDQTVTAEDAERVCRLERERDDGEESVQAVHPESGVVDEMQLGFGRSKLNSTVAFGKLGVGLKVLRWFSGARPGGPTGPVQVMPGRGTYPAIQFQPGGEVAGQEPQPFWVIGGEKPTKPVGEVPPALSGMLFQYNPSVWQPLSLRVVEGPPGTFRLVELVDGRLAKIREIPMGGALDVEGGKRIELKQFLRGARVEYRPGGPAPGRKPEAAVRLAVSRGGGEKPQEFWFFPGRSRPHEVLGGRFAVRPRPGGLAREAVTLEVIEGSTSVGRFTVEPGRPLVRKGYTVCLAGISSTGVRDGRTIGLVKLDITRRPGTWAVYAGMLLLALGVPWLLWSRFRRVPDAANEDL